MTLTDQELNEAVARKLGYELLPTDRILPNGKPLKAWGKPPFYETNWLVPPYSTDIKAAWEIVESLATKAESIGTGPIIEISHDGSWHCKFGVIVTQAPTAPRAICEAFLKLP